MAATTNNGAVELGDVVISEGLTISQDELKTIMAVNKDWPFAAEQIGGCYERDTGACLCGAHCAGW